MKLRPIVRADEEKEHFAKKWTRWFGYFLFVVIIIAIVYFIFIK